MVCLVFVVHVCKKKDMDSCRGIGSIIYMLTSAAAGLIVMATDTRPSLESLDMEPKGEPKNIAEGSVLITCSLISDPGESNRKC